MTLWSVLITIGIIVLLSVLIIQIYSAISKGKRKDLAAKEHLLEQQQIHVRELEENREAALQEAQELREREAVLERKNELLDRREHDLRNRQQQMDRDEVELRQQTETVLAEIELSQQELERISGLSQEVAESELLERARKSTWEQAAKEGAALITQTQKEAEQQATEVIARSLYKIAGDFVGLHAVTSVALPNDEMKGRIIGKEGRNIRNFEALTGVDLIIDDTPNVVVLSCFHPMRREIAKIAMEFLVADGRIHVAAIEKAVERAGLQIADRVRQQGEATVIDLDIRGFAPELVEAIGMLHYHEVEGANLLTHAVEVASIAESLALELSLSHELVKQVKRAAILHDIGLVVKQDGGLHHADAGALWARKHGESEDIAAAIEQHHEDHPQTLLALLVNVSNHVSKRRPGARQKSQGIVFTRNTHVEQLAMEHDGVTNAWVFRSGTELRVVVDSGHVAADEVAPLAFSIAQHITQSITQNEIKIHVIHRTQATAIAH